MKTFGIVLGCLLAGSAFAFDVPPNDGFITDAANVLTAEEEEALEADLSAYRDQTGNEIAVVILQTLAGDVAADVAVEIGRKWGIGGAANDNGVILLIAYEDRQIFLGTGYGLEGALPDIIVKGIIETDIAPPFREGKYGEGIRAGVESMKKHIGGEYTAERYSAPESVGGFDAFLLFLLFIFLQWAIAIMARTKSWWLGGVFGGVLGLAFVFLIGWYLAIPLFVGLGLLLDYIVSKNFHARGKTAWWAGGGWGPGGGGRGSGGFGGFSGGSFGGGGAGGHW